MILGSWISDPAIALLPSPEEQKAEDEQADRPDDPDEPEPRRRVDAVEQRVPDQGQVRVHGVDFHDREEYRMVGQLVFDGKEDSGAAEPEPTDDRHEVRQVGNLMADPGQEAGETDIEDSLQDDHGDD